MTAPRTSSGHAVVLGASLAGVLAAAVLARRYAAVTVVDRDELPPEPQPRTGLPQARHVHQLWSSGGRAIDQILPGMTAQLFAAGAKCIGIPRQHVSLTAFGWQHRFPESQHMISCGRPLLDFLVRQRVLADERITLRAGVQAVGVTGDARRVTGALLRSVADGSTSELPADLVVDTTGRASAMRRWLAELGAGEVTEDVVDSGITYATRTFRVPDWAGDDFPGVSIHADHRDGQPGRNGQLLPIDGNRWIVTLSGTRGGEPPAGDDEFVQFAGSLRHPIIAELVAAAEPLTSVQRSRSTANRRLYYELVPDWPAGLVLLGDAVAAFNPVYGHGMVAAARSAGVLESELRLGGAPAEFARRVMRGVAAVVDEPWALATSQDICFPNCRTVSRDPRLTRFAGMRQNFADLVGATATRQPVVSAAVVEVTTLSSSADCLGSPDVVVALRDGPTHPVLDGPPFTPEERARLRRSGRAKLAAVTG
ncbi:enterotoxin [Micromonospora tulbaghiae]|uniref:Enterotoxin n=1 Tax=Micromonospora tulbaghiae TaxID=479978 RepID=A0A386WVD9_9ACTN|nr:FAD-dependent monooxygenase [Micromonospora tulbaghiae]AYF31943.1 enterotoxin [Micromonospora tulbaghiae]